MCIITGPQQEGKQEEDAEGGQQHTWLQCHLQRAHQCWRARVCWVKQTGSTGPQSGKHGRQMWSNLYCYMAHNRIRKIHYEPWHYWCCTRIHTCVFFAQHFTGNRTSGRDGKLPHESKWSWTKQWQRGYKTNQNKLINVHSEKINFLCNCVDIILGREGRLGSQCSDNLLGTFSLPQVFTVSRWREDGLCVVAFVAGPVLLPALSRLEHIFQESMMI